MTNHLILSDDGMTLIIEGAGGQRATLRSARPGGFTSGDLEKARDYTFSPTLLPGQINTAWKFVVFRHGVYVHLGTGPPTWWLPRIKIGKTQLMLGWLRVMVGVAVKKEDDTTEPR